MCIMGLYVDQIQLASGVSLCCCNMSFVFPGGAPGQFAWQGGEMTMTYKDGTSVAIETNQGQGNEEVEVMSTDSSSSSSTDSNWKNSEALTR